MAYATLQDLQVRYRQLRDDEFDRALALLEDASDLIDTTCRGAATANASTLKRVCCQVVARALQSQQAGVSQQSETTGPFTMMTTYANPSGDLYLTRAERNAINGGQQAWSSEWGGAGGAD